MKIAKGARLCVHKHVCLNKCFSVCVHVWGVHMCVCVCTMHICTRTHEGQSEPFLSEFSLDWKEQSCFQPAQAGAGFGVRLPELTYLRMDRDLCEASQVQDLGHHQFVG